MPNARHHEDWTADAICDDGTDVHRALESLSSGMAGRVHSLLAGGHRLQYLERTISGPWDVDRADYLLRDSYMTGVRYGVYDLDWLLRAFTFAQTDSGDWVLAIEGRKGLPPIEGFFLARHYMYQQVYHHKATRAAEALIRGILARLAELIRDGSPPAATPEALRLAACGETVQLGAYLDLDDAVLLSAIAGWTKCGDAILAGLCADLLARRLPKTLPLPEDDEDAWRRAVECAVDITNRAGLRADLLVRLDVASDVPYADSHDATDGLFVQIRHRSLQRLGDASFLLQHLRDKEVRRPRLIFPSELRHEIRAAVRAELGAGVG